MLWAINSGARRWRCINRVGRRAAEQRADQLWPKLTYYLYLGAPGIAPTLAPTVPRDLASPSVRKPPLCSLRPHRIPGHFGHPARAIVPPCPLCPEGLRVQLCTGGRRNCTSGGKNTRQRRGWILFVRDAEGKHPTQTHTHTDTQTIQAPGHMGRHAAHTQRQSLTCWPHK